MGSGIITRTREHIKMRPTKLLMLASLAATTVLVTYPAMAESDKTATFDAGSSRSFAGAVLAGRTAESDRDLATAIELYERALGFEPTNTDIKQRLMVLLFNNGMFDEGIAIANDLKGDPVLENVSRLALGIDAIRQREYKNAENLLSYAGVNDLERLVYGLLQAWALQGDGELDKAQAAIDKLEGPDWYGIFKTFHSAALEEASGNVDQARRLYTELITDQNSAGTAPDTYIRATMALAGMESRDGNRQKALDAIATGSAFSAGYAPLKALRQRVDANDPPNADIRNAAEGASAVLYTIGSALNRSGAEDFVSLYLNFAHSLDPDNAATLIMLGSLAENLGKPEQAIDIYRRVPDDSVMHRVSELQLGLNLADLGRLEEAKGHLKNLIDQDTQDMRSYLAYGSVLSDAKSYREMADNYDKAANAIGLLPKRSHWNIYFQRGIAYERLKEWEKAEPNFKRALELSPNQSQVMNYLGYSWIDMNINLEEGMDLIRDAVRLRPNDGYVVDSLGWAYYRLGDYENAVEELERAVEIRPGDPTINDHLGDAYWRAGRRLEAGFQWKRALTMKPELADVPKIEQKIDVGLPDIMDPAPSASKTPDDESKRIQKPENGGQKGQLNEVPDAMKASYEVKPGQTLWTIAVEVLGDGHLYRDILRANPSLNGDADLIHPGQIIKLP
jgi:tetratricopeptide (TPR) repeat protein